MGEKITESQDLYELFKLCDIAVNNMFKYYDNVHNCNMLNEFNEILEEFTYLDFNEMFIVIDDVICLDTKKLKIREYRKETNTFLKKEKMQNTLKDTFDKYNKNKKSKLEKRDFGNVKNQISRLMEKLNLSVLYFYNQNEKNNNIKMGKTKR